MLHESVPGVARTDIKRPMRASIGKGEALRAMGISEKAVDNGTEASQSARLES
jgi:hypothetical protein